MAPPIRARARRSARALLSLLGRPESGLVRFLGRALPGSGRLGRSVKALSAVLLALGDASPVRSLERVSRGELRAGRFPRADSDIRVSALGALRYLRARRAVTRLLPLLLDADEAVRRAATLAACRLRLPGATALLIERLDRSLDAGAAIRALRILKAREAGPSLLRHIDEPGAPEALRTALGDEADELLLSALRSGPEALHPSASRLLAEGKGERRREALLSLAGDELASASGRQHALGALAASGSAGWIERVISWLGGESDELRGLALALLLRHQPDAVSPALRRLFLSGQEHARLEAAVMLAGLRDPIGGPFLLDRLSHPDSAPRAAAALCALRDGTLLPLLVEVCRSGTEPARSFAPSCVAALSDEDRPSSLEALSELLLLTDPVVLAATLTALGGLLRKHGARFVGERVMARVPRLLGRGEPAVLAAAIGLLAASGERGGLEDIEALASHPDAGVRAAARDGARQIHARAAGPRHRLEQRAEPPRDAACASCGELP